MKEISALNTTTPYKQSTVSTTVQPEKKFSTIMQEELNTIQKTVPATNKGDCDIVSGRIGIDYLEKGVPFRVKYFDEQGELLTNSSFNAESILKMTNQFNIDISDLKGIGEQLDALNVGYRPYALYPGTGSDHGINFDDLINGGPGTAYDWRKDDLAYLKGPDAEEHLAKSQQFAQSLGLYEQSTINTPAQPEKEVSTVMQKELSTVQKTVPATNKGNCDIVSGRIGIDYLEKGVPFRVNYFDEQGDLLTNSSFNAESILKMTNKFNIDLTDLKGIGEQLDALNVGYRPYALYAGTGSDHGIDFDDLINGGLGTAYDWRKDDLAYLKGPGADERLAKSQQFAQSLGLNLNPQITKA